VSISMLSSVLRNVGGCDLAAVSAASLAVMAAARLKMVYIDQAQRGIENVHFRYNFLIS
jgi:hypothetical protein